VFLKGHLEEDTSK